MALMSGLLSVPVGIRFAALTKDGIVMMWFFTKKDSIILS
jgi:hypothetical protein